MPSQSTSVPLTYNSLRFHRNKIADVFRIDCHIRLQSFAFSSNIDQNRGFCCCCCCSASLYRRWDFNLWSMCVTSFLRSRFIVSDDQNAEHVWNPFSFAFFRDSSLLLREEHFNQSGESITQNPLLYSWCRNRGFRVIFSISSLAPCYHAPYCFESPF